MYVLSIAFFNFSGLTISKYASATSRTIVDTLRTIIVWGFFLVMPFVPEDTKETFSWLQLLGFLVLILGGLIYNEILVLKFWGFNVNTKAAIKKREKEEADKKKESVENKQDKEYDNKKETSEKKEGDITDIIQTVNKKKEEEDKLLKDDDEKQN